MIDPDKYYSPIEAARLDTKLGSYSKEIYKMQVIYRDIRGGRLKAEIINPGQKKNRYRVKGSDFIDYVRSKKGYNTALTDHATYLRESIKEIEEI